MAASKSNEPQRISAADLAKMKTHDLAELLSSFVLLLRRLPNVPFDELAQLPTEQQASNAGDDLVSKANERQNGHGQPGWWAGKGTNSDDHGTHLAQR